MRANGRARVSAQNPQAFGICDRCGLRWNRIDLAWQYEWAGMQLQNRRILVCPTCLDEPNPQLRTYIPPPDPLPVRDPRPDNSAMGGATVVTTVAATSAMLMPAGTVAQSVAFQAPYNAGIWINTGGGLCGPGLTGCMFLSPGAPFSTTNFPANIAITYYCPVAGLTVVVETDAAGGSRGTFFLDTPPSNTLDGSYVLG